MFICPAYRIKKSDIKLFYSEKTEIVFPEDNSLLLDVYPDKRRIYRGM